jgi:hypothetical protein
VADFGGSACLGHPIEQVVQMPAVRPLPPRLVLLLLQMQGGLA